MTPGSLTYEFPQPSRWNKFLVGLAIDALATVLLIVLDPHLATVISQPVTARHYVTLVAPGALVKTQPSPPSPISAPAQVAKVEKLKLAPVPLENVKPPQPPKTATTQPAVPEIPKPTASAASNAPVSSKPSNQIQTDVFGAAPSQTATVQKPARQVQTGGFGDPNGIPGQGDPNRNTVKVAAVGSFDLPGGPGKGNGSAGSHGAAGTIRSAGFSDSAVQSTPRHDDRTLQSSGFRPAVAEPAAPTRQPIQEKPVLQPVEIVYKPRPAYTPEARHLHVEGEVLLDVIFTASGSLRVNRVVKGLGYGLDDKALEAAQRIQFRPARKDGQPYDCAALVHILFELSK